MGDHGETGSNLGKGTVLDVGVWCTEEQEAWFVHSPG